MSYLRGEYYTYATGDGPDDEVFAFGLGYVPLEVFDAVVAMRAAELAKEGRLEQVERITIERHAGNFGSFALMEKYGQDPMGDLVRHLDEIKRAKGRATTE